MIINGNSLEELKKFPDNYFHSVVTDPPYGLSFMGKKWDYDVPSVELWQQVFRVLKEGGYLLSFAGTRTQHRMAVNIEDAGFEIRDMIAWVYGSGFPKSHNIGKAIDKLNGRKYEDNFKVAKYLKESRENKGITKSEVDNYLGTITLYSWYEGRPKGTQLPTQEHYNKLKVLFDLDNRFDLLIQRIEAEREVIGKKTSGIGTSFGKGEWKSGKAEEVDISIPKTEQAKQWEGWGTALKPALEPITMARKPFKGTVANNVLKNGVGGINIDGCRVGNDTSRGDRYNGKSAKGNNFGVGNIDDKKNTNKSWEVPVGRFPANFIHDGSDEVKDLFPYTKTGDTNAIPYTNTSGKNVYGKQSGVKKQMKGDSGSASRFFYCAKASKQDRNEGLEDFEYKRKADRKIADGKGGENPRNRTNTKKQNHHPTVKPTNLMKYLVRLVTPKNGIVLDCFMGSGSTGKACALEGFEFVGIDLDKDYCEIAKARIDKAIEDKKQAEAQQELF